MTEFKLWIIILCGFLVYTPTDAEEGKVRKSVSNPSKHGKIPFKQGGFIVHFFYVEHLILTLYRVAVAIYSHAYSQMDSKCCDLLNLWLQKLPRPYTQHIYNHIGNEGDTQRPVNYPVGKPLEVIRVFKLHFFLLAVVAIDFMKWKFQLKF